MSRHDRDRTDGPGGARWPWIDVSLDVAARTPSGGRTGTHVAAPRPVGGNGDAHVRDLAALNGPGRVLEIGADRIGVDALVEHGVQAGERVLLRTSNTATAWHTRPVGVDHAHLAADGARHLVDRGVEAVGIDHLLIGCPHRDGLEVQEVLSEAGVPVLAGLVPDEVEAGAYELRCLPLSRFDGSAAPARALLRRSDRPGRDPAGPVASRWPRAAAERRSSPGRPHPRTTGGPREMTGYGYHASHEQLPPGELLDLVRAAEAAGFTSAMCSDHAAPWSARQGHSGYAFAWLGAALATTQLPMGVVTAPGQRTHPVVTAQALATLAQMNPGRVWAALGSGQALNEHITGDRWPGKAERVARLEECVEVIRALLAGETVDHHGRVRVDRARVWSLPQRSPELYGAAVTPGTATAVARWADGLVTVNQPDDAHVATLAAYRDAGGRGPAVLQAHLSWAPDRETALALAHDQWREPALGGDVAWEIALPEHFEQAARFVAPDQVLPHVHVSAEPGEHADWLAGQAAHGFDTVVLHQVGQEQRAFLDVFAEHVLPGLPS